MRARSWIWIAAATLLALGCARQPKMGVNQIKDVNPKRYQQTLERFTSSQRVYDKLETKLLVTAVYRSWSYRDAYVDEVARREVRTREEREAMKKNERADWEIYHSFVITAYTPETRHLALSVAEDAVWKMRLYDAKGNFTEAVVAQRIDQTDKTYDEYLPSNLWGRTYIVKFPREQLPARPKTLTLQLASALGVAELDFDLTGEPVPEGPGLHALDEETTPEVKAEADENAPGDD